jgi:hypothetical protein
MKSSRIFITAIALLVACQVKAAFVDWRSVNTTNQTASGTLDSVAVTLTTTVRVPNSFSNGGILGGVLDGTSMAFSNSWFTPNIPLTDCIALASSSSFAIPFSPPITNPTLHLYQLASSTLTFSDGTSPISFTLLNSDGSFNIATGASATAIQGKAIAYFDANGSLFFAGAFSDIQWTATTPNQDDGFNLQISATSGPSLMAQLVASSIVCSWPTNAAGFGLQWSTTLPARSWSNVVQATAIVGTNYSVTILPLEFSTVFRLAK